MPLASGPTIAYARSMLNHKVVMTQLLHGAVNGQTFNHTTVARNARRASKGVGVVFRPPPLNPL